MTMMFRKKILITVKTYPNLSSKYDELVCTAGVLEDGSWIRLYPIPFRRMEYEGQFKKYDWIEINVSKRKEDPRPESFTPDIETMDIVGNIKTTNNWAERKEFLLKNVYDNMKELIDQAHKNKLSLAVFKPQDMIRFEYEIISEEERDEYKNKMQAILNKRKQIQLIDDGLKDIYPVSKPDYRFYYEFQDAKGKKSKMVIEDWEIQALYRKCNKGDKEKAVSDVYKKYWDEFALKKDLYFFLGTTLKSHVRKFTNPFTIIGTFTPDRHLYPETGKLL